MLLFALAACNPEPAVTDEPDAITYECTPDENCLDAGVQRFVSNGEDREITVLLPADPQGAPVVFAWHYLNGSAGELIEWLQLQKLADAGYIVVAPSSRKLATEWDLVASDTNADFRLFDDLLAAERAQYGSDRVYATGFSAGGLFTTLLTMHRADDLDATAPFSGGSPPANYHTPSAAIPVLVTWGGPSDSFAGFDFDEASQNLADELTNDGSFVVTCEHSMGHWLPNDSEAHLQAFLEGGAAWEDDPELIPTGCEAWK